MLSTRAKMAIRACVAVVIAYAIALHMDWEKPYWAAWTAYSIGLASRGEGIQKGLLRLGVTLLACHALEQPDRLVKNLSCLGELAVSQVSQDHAR